MGWRCEREGELADNYFNLAEIHTEIYLTHTGGAGIPPLLYRKYYTILTFLPFGSPLKASIASSQASNPISSL